ncbi:MAG: exodeoxyribonuclease VII small subunit [Ruminococcaceae bacterium]|nr:exodeoxyribonuclease VII small subunit [Oscillospiraceae bacterium]
MAAKKTVKEEISFEEAMERIGVISDKLGEGTLTLDESVELYTEGMRLVAYCKEKLDDAEMKISVVDDKKTNKKIKYTTQEE